MVQLLFIHVTAQGYMWGGVVLGSTPSQGLRLLSGDATCLNTWAPMLQQEGERQRVHTWEMLYGPGLEGVYITLVHIPLAPPGCRSLGSLTFLPTQGES